MQQITYKERLNSLVDIAGPQAGYFSAYQAALHGISHDNLTKLTRTGHIVRELRGVYRLARWPTSVHSDLWRAVQWTHAKRGPVNAALSHRTALELHDISDINPEKIDLTLPVSMIRTQRAAPPAVSLHFATLREQEVEYIDGLPVTTIYRTLVDLLLESTARDAVLVAIENASSRKLIAERDSQRLRALSTLDRSTLEDLARALPARHRSK